MAVTARFLADFSSFNQAVDKAEAKLTDFTSGASKVEKALARMTDSFSGRRVLQEATLMEKAVQAIGGTSKLTAAELQRVGSTAEAAIAKLRALGSDVPAGLQKIAEEATKAGKASGGFADKLATVNGLLGGLGVGLSVGALVGFGKAILNDADALTKMRDRTGISIDGLQRLQVAGDDAGNTIDEISGAINQFQNRLASGDKSAVGALDKLGVSLEDIQSLAPERQFMAISDALRNVSDPAQQVAIAMDLFGRVGAQVLPTLKRGFDDVRDAAVGMSTETAERLDQLGDSMQASIRKTKGFAAEAFVTLMDFVASAGNGTIARVQKDIRDTEALILELQGMAKKATGPKLFAETPQTQFSISDSDQRAFLTAMDERQRAVDKQRDTAERAAKAAKEYQDAAVTAQLKAEKAATDDLAASLKAITRQRLMAGGTVLKEIAVIGPQVTRSLDQMTLGLKRLVSVDVSSLLKRNLGDSVKSIFAGDFGQVFKDGGAFLKGGLSKIGTGILEGFGNIISGGVSGLVSMGIGAVVKGIGKLFGNNDEKQINPIRQSFVDMAGGLDTLNKRAAAAGVTLTAMLNAKNPEQYKKAIDDLNAALQFQDSAMQTLDETVKKYGLSLEELGPALQRQNLDKKAQELFQDFKVLTGAGVSVDNVLGRMGDSINAFLHDALKTGSEVPAAMAPMLQRMTEMGVLTDENGNVITDLASAGVKFAETMTEGFNRIVASVDRLIDAIQRGLGTAIRNIPQPVIQGRIEWQSDKYGGINPAPAPLDPIPMASGGAFRVTKPTLFMAGEAGPEDAVFSGANKSFGSAATDVSGLASEVSALRRELVGGMFATQMALAIQTAAAKQGAGRR